MPFILPVLSLAGAAAGAVGSIAQGNAAAASADYQAEVARNNALLANQQAGTALAAGHEQAEETSLAGAQQLGKFKAEQGASGVDLNTGSAALARGSLRMVNQLRTQNVEYNAERSAWGYRAQGINFANQSNLDTAQAKADKTAGMIGAAGKIIGGVGGLVGGLSGIGGGGGGGGIFGSASPIAGGGSLSSPQNWGDIPDDEFDGSDAPYGGGIGRM